MRLTSIKLSGFKSFVDPTNFQVAGELVGVVGPNGCGKSNIIDAVRWVLGESRASELRGESMQDVIFNGTDSRKPSGRSSVELIFDNASGKAGGQWGQYAEISVKRILTRDGSSTYYINNHPVRRRDIQDIFMGTGLGPRAYAIIGQGMISRIIEARPEELRIFLEEAAGVSIYKERRRETENRLKDAHENLLRVEDIRRELDANLERLEAQAIVARKYHTLHAEQDEKQKLLWLLRRNEADEEQQKLMRDIERAQIGLDEQTAGLRQAEAALEHLRQAHFDSSDRVHQAQGVLYQTNSEIGSLEAQIRFVIESRTRLQNQLTAISRQRDQWQQQGQQQQDELAQSEQRREELVTNVAQAQEVVRQHNEALPVFEQAWREAQENANALRGGIANVQQQIGLESANHRNASATLSAIVGRRERLTEENKGMQAPDDDRLSQLKEELEASQRALIEAEQQIDTLRDQRSLQEESLRAIQQQLLQETSGQTQIEARLNALKQLQDSVQSQAKVQPWLEKHELHGLPRLWQKLQIEAGWETALESILRERVMALEMSNIDWAKAFFNDAPPAKLALFSPAANTGTAAAETISGLTPILSLLKLNDPGLRALMQDWLHNLFVADNTTAAFSTRDKLPVGAYLVTREGHVISRSGVCFYAPDSEQDGMMTRRQEIDSLTKQQRAQHLLAEESKAKVIREEAALTQINRQLQEIRQTASDLTKSIHTLQIDLLKLNELHERYRQRSTQISAELDEIAAQEADIRQTLAEGEARLEQLDIDLGQAQERFEDSQTIYLDRERELAEARNRLRELERAAQEAEFAERAQRSRIDELRRSIATAMEQSEKLLKDMQQGSLELETLDDQAAQAGLQTLLDQRMGQEKALADARHELDQVSQQVRKGEETRLEAERGLQPLRERIIELQLKEQAARLNRDGFAQQLIDAEADEAALMALAQSDMKPQYLQGEVTRLTNAIAALGAVNLAALEELETASERKRHLDSQHADLTEAINTLEDAIRRIDRETRDRLQETFDKVNKHFSELFPILFGGGKASLIMTGGEILDSGVQVMAQPPGKKNATIQLLSGGEKAMTAIALVFAMFQLNPAPFCLLDEVDAPLDDANTERYCNMVKQMSSNTQFLFITHNKIAMEMAQELIGVTMQEQGVSRIVVVDLASATDLASEARAA
ncbi:MAG: chromosome segregation protein SMC [Oxalobacter sp.]|nr:MAG: chromosome segregation protein SMC [Oxalobacter sp.]